MVGVSTIIAVCVTLFISLVLPFILYIGYGFKNRGMRIKQAWLLGAAGFFVLQVVIRIPILNLLSLNEGFISFATEHYVLYCLILAFTAALFELVGRYVVAKIMSKNLTYERSIAAGLGHGGIEAIHVVGMTYLNNLIYIIMINTGEFDEMLEQTAALGVDTSSLVVIKEALIGSGASIFLLAGYERILTMIAHVALSLVVCYFVAKKKDVLGIGICLVCHWMMDFISSLVSGMATEYMGNILSTRAAYAIIYIFLTVVAVVAVFAIRYLKKSWKVQA